MMITGITVMARPKIDGPIFGAIDIALERLHQHGQRIFFPGRNENEGREEVVPRGNKGEDAQCHRARNGQRQHDAMVDADFAGAVDTCGIDQLPDNDRLKVLHAKEDSEGAERWPAG